MKTKKITMATLKSFIKKNINNLYVKCESRFDGMSDMVEQNNDATFEKVNGEKISLGSHGSFGIDGFWTVWSSRDCIQPISENGFTGFEVYNCCGTSLIAIKN